MGNIQPGGTLELPGDEMKTLGHKVVDMLIEYKETFHIMPEYLKDIVKGEEEVNFCDYGIQLTRSFRALKLWRALDGV